MIDLILSADFFATFLRVMTPLLLAALGVMISEKAGVLNIGMEGMMLAGAFVAVIASAATGSPWLGLLAAVATGAGLGLLMSFAVNGLGAHFIIAGIALNVAAVSGTTLGLFMLTGERGMSGSLKSGTLPVIDLGGVPLVSGHHVLTWAALALVGVIHIVLTRTPFGLRLRAVGVDPASTAIAGVSVVRMQAAALAMSGALGGMAGAYLSLGYVTWFAEGMTAGRDFVAIAIAIMGFGSAIGTFLSTLIIAFAEALTFTLQTLGLPSELLQTIPYVVPVVVLTLWSSRTLRRRGASH